MTGNWHYNKCYHKYPRGIIKLTSHSSQTYVAKNGELQASTTYLLTSVIMNALLLEIIWDYILGIYKFPWRPKGDEQLSHKYITNTVLGS